MSYEKLSACAGVIFSFTQCNVKIPPPPTTRTRIEEKLAFPCGADFKGDEDMTMTGLKSVADEEL